MSPPRTPSRTHPDNAAASQLALELARTVALYEEEKNTTRALRTELQAVTIRMERAEAAADAYRDAGGRKGSLDPRVLRALVSMTPKQHAVLQLVLAGKSNEEVAAAFRLTQTQRGQLSHKLGDGESYMPMSVSTVKGMIRAIGHHLALGGLDAAGEHDRMTRAEIIALVKGTFDTMSEEDYERTARLPKTWGSAKLGDDHLRHPELYLTKRQIKPPSRKRRPGSRKR